MNITIDDIDENVCITASQGIAIAIAEKLDKETFKLIKAYCEEKGIIPNIIEKDKLDLVLRLGIQALNEREWNK